MMKSFLLFLTLFFPREDLHDIHVSVCDIEIKEKSVQLTLKTFLDDLQLAVGLKPGEEIPEDYSSADEMISEYLMSVIDIEINGNEQQLKIEDISAAQDAVWIAIDVEEVPSNLLSVVMKNRFLTDIYKDQTNIVNFRINSKKHSHVLNKKKKIATYEIN